MKKRSVLYFNKKKLLKLMYNPLAKRCIRSGGKRIDMKFFEDMFNQ